MLDIVCWTCRAGDGTHERWCAVGHRIAEMAAKDKRIAELEQKEDDYDAEMTIVARALTVAFGDGRLDAKDKANAQLWDIAQSKKWMTEQVDEMKERIAELEAALMRLWPAPDIQEVLAGNHEALDAAIAAAKREGVEMAIEHLESSDCPIPIDRMPPGQTKRQFSNTVIEFLILELRELAKEVK